MTEESAPPIHDEARVPSSAAPPVQHHTGEDEDSDPDFDDLDGMSDR